MTDTADHTQRLAAAITRTRAKFDAMNEDEQRAFIREGFCRVAARIAGITEDEQEETTR